jgi:quercetin dioxygenase-like cupin family protein
VVPPGGGDARWVTGSLDVVKATAAQTGGAFGLIESTERRGDAPPLHVHSDEDEAYYVIEGELTFFVGEEEIRAPAGTPVYAPRRIPHSYRVDSSASKIVVVNVPGGWEGFFSEAGDAASAGEEPRAIEPDLERLGELAARRGVTILGDPPA